MKIFRKLLINYKSIGLFKTLKKIILKFFDIIYLNDYKKKKIKKLFLSKQTIEEKFNIIYNTNYWSDGQSRSGSGSNPESTKSIKFHLPKIIKDFEIKSIFDAPCGDLNWMREILKTVDIAYHGSDIVEDIIVKNRKDFKKKNIEFSKKNIIIDKLPDCDLMICRDCLFHFSYRDIFLFFENFTSSNIKYLLMTSHLNENRSFINVDIETGDYRLIDIFSEPFNFKKKYFYTFDDRDHLEIDNFKQMYLFSKEQIKKKGS